MLCCDGILAEISGSVNNRTLRRQFTAITPSGEVKAWSRTVSRNYYYCVRQLPAQRFNAVLALVIFQRTLQLTAVFFVSVGLSQMQSPFIPWLFTVWVFRYLFRYFISFLPFIVYDLTKSLGLSRIKVGWHNTVTQSLTVKFEARYNPWSTRCVSCTAITYRHTHQSLRVFVVGQHACVTARK